MNEEDKKRQRAQRFGLVRRGRGSHAPFLLSSAPVPSPKPKTCPHFSSNPSLSPPTPTNKQPSSDEDEEKKQKRRERFGGGAGAANGAAAAGGANKISTAQKAELMDPEKMKARLERFGAAKPTAGMSEAEKKKARAARFGAAA